MPPAGAESYAAIPPNSTGPQVRTIQVTTFVDGVPLTVDMQVIAIADGQGNVIDQFVDYNFQRRVIEELSKIRELLGNWLGVPFQPTPP